ncbi:MULTISPECIES: T3SS effector HopA1 family protein [unclassified Brenneria]|uniref:T3SS effector HopA1 family protein n=1 Tax=unclassified Brenneria TaxID=2634434 RepID=UPI0015527517|nr:T3SS effector HopA1 family protein [Brenneria sp. hezel4-2-4]MEE3651636.1 T3SS effector HopA1 family protein [Brenneria sp. HEZEL_4_2_4]NPD01593.1 hypothetical protein [Brenneria sp. hezel4-2-4]
MQPITPRFSSLQQLQSSSVDVKSLLDHGSLEVNGKKYHISTAEGATLHVALAEKATGFFNAVGNMMGGSGESKAIAQILESKPRLIRSNAMRVFEKSEHATASSSTATQGRERPASSIPVDDSLKSIQHWARQAKQLDSPSAREIYALYKSEKPNLPLIDPKDAKILLHKFVALHETEGVDVFPQQFGPIDKNLFKGYLREHPAAADNFIMFARRASGDSEGTTSRITLSVHSRNAVQLPDVLHALIRDKDYLASAKIAHPAFFGQDADSVIFYLKGHVGEALNLTNEIQKLLPQESLIEHNLAGMYRLDKGFSYAETAPGDVSSHGKSRANIIYNALNETKFRDIDKRLQKQLDLAGYDKNHPAFIKDSPSLAFINANRA